MGDSNSDVRLQIRAVRVSQEVHQRVVHHEEHDLFGEINRRPSFQHCSNLITVDSEKRMELPIFEEFAVYGRHETALDDLVIERFEFVGDHGSR